MKETHNMHIPVMNRFSWIFPEGTELSQILLCKRHGEPSVDVTLDESLPDLVKYEFAVLGRTDEKGWTESVEELPEGAESYGSVTIEAEFESGAKYADIHLYLLGTKTLTPEEVRSEALQEILRRELNDLSVVLVMGEGPGPGTLN